jgi:hypothetical protein
MIPPHSASACAESTPQAGRIEGFNGFQRNRLQQETTMQARIAQIKSTTPHSETLNVAPANATPETSLARSGSREFVRMALAAVASGIVFGLVSGLVVWLIASYQHLDGTPADLATAPQAVESR